MKIIKLHLLSIIILTFASICATSAAAQQAVLLSCTYDTSSVYKAKDGSEKFERRFYYTDIVTYSRAEYLRIDSTGDRIEGACGAYFEKTVLKAAADRGEKISDSGTLRVIRNIDMTGNNIGQGDFYKFAPREEVIKKRDEAIKEMKDANRAIIQFNWDPTGAAEAADYAKEAKRIPANMAVSAPPKTEPKTNTSASVNPGTTVNPSFIFGWARIMTKVADTSKPSNSPIDRAYYTNVTAFAPNADANALKQQISTYFNQYAVADATRVEEKVVVRDVQVKTFPTLVEADNARFAAASDDNDKLNANVQNTTVNTSYLNWNLYGGRGTLFDKIPEFSVSTSELWFYVIFEVRAEKQVGGQTVRETRYYVSYPFELIVAGRDSTYRNNYIDSYFTKTVVEPAKAKGVKLDYYDNEIKVMPFSYAYKTYAEAWEKRNEDLETIKYNGYPQYDFLLQTSGANLGEKTSYPFCASGCTGERARVTASK